MNRQQLKVTSPQTRAAAQPAGVPTGDHPLLGLQRLAGNRAACHVSASADGPLIVQRSLFSKIFGRNKKTSQPVKGGSDSGPGGKTSPSKTGKGSKKTASKAPPKKSGKGTTAPKSSPRTSSKVETPKVETPKVETPKVETPPQDVPTPELTLLEKVRSALGSPTGLSTLRAVYSKSSMVDRAALWQDDDLMAKAQTNLSEADWISFLADVGVYRQGGTVAHATAKSADEGIRERFKDYIGDAVANGKSVEGRAVVLDGEDWFRAYYHEFPNELPRGGPTDDEPTTNAFTTTKPPRDVIVLNKNKGNPGTTIHEGMHLYQHDASMKLGSAFQEGITEWLTRQLTGPLGIDRSRNYQGNFTVADLLVKAVTEEVVVKAYFKGETAELKAALTKFWKGKGADGPTSESNWTAFRKAFNDKKWDDARKFLE